jgi:hypothetical protein
VHKILCTSSPVFSVTCKDSYKSGRVRRLTPPAGQLGGMCIIQVVPGHKRRTELSGREIPRVLPFDQGGPMSGPRQGGSVRPEKWLPEVSAGDEQKRQTGESVK